MVYLTLRNLELYFRDRTAVILSLLAEVIVMVLYIVFMRDNLLKTFDGLNNADMILDLWMIAGILGITPVTASMGAYGIMIEDRAGEREKDFLISPLSDTTVISSYILSGVLASVIMSFAVLVMFEIYIMIVYGRMAGIGNIIMLYVIIVIDSLCCSALTLVPVSFIKSSNALAGCCTILGALIGFMTGIYLPIGSLSENVGIIIKSFPVSHGSALFRQLLATDVIEESIGQGSYTSEVFMEYMGIYFTYDGDKISPQTEVIILIGTAVVCTIAAVFIRKCMRGH